VKRYALPMITLLLLTACKTAPKPVQVLEVCPKVPMLELNLPAGAMDHDFIGTTQQLLQGKLPSRPSYRLHYAPVSPTPLRLNAN